MPIKIFQASGHEAIKRLEPEINEWLTRMAGGTNATNRVKQMSTAATATKEDGSGEVRQHLVITVLHD